MKTTFNLLLIFMFPYGAWAQAPSATPTALVLTHVAVIDTTGGPAQPDQTVVIRGGRIVEVGKGGKVRVRAGSQVVNATGKFLIPGLWDMHFHWYDEGYLPLTIVNGVTGVRIMLGYAEHYQWRKQIEADQLLGPRIVIASRALDGPKPLFPGPPSASVTNATEARQAVINAKEHGADFVKVLSYLPRDAFFAIADEAKKRGISFVGHVPNSVTVEEASNSGIRSIEHLTGMQHLTGMLDACSSRAADLLKLWQEALANFDASDQTDASQALASGAAFRARMQMALDTYDPHKAAMLFTLLKTNHTWISPTLTTERNEIFFDDPSIATDAWLKYTAAGARGGWKWERDSLSKEYSPEDVALLKQVYRKDLELVGAMRRAGVEFLAGTDTGNEFTVPGFSLHDELGLLVEAGFTPLQALQAATLSPARFLGREGDLGTVAPGKIADLVLLDANPLENINNTRKIAAVLYRGKLYDRSVLNAMLSKIQALASKKDVADVLEPTMREKGVDAVISQYRELRSTQPDSYDFDDVYALSGVGRHLMKAKKVQDAIQIFQLNTEEFPKSWWAYDNLGDAYVYASEKELAVKSFEKSQQLDPLYQYATVRLRQLNSQ